VLARSQIQEVFPLAACPWLAENSRLGFATVASTSQWASGFSISSNTLGLSPSLYDGRVRPRSTGKERDTESGNDYFGARYYASSMGRFLSPDWAAKAWPVPYAKLDDPQTLNLYGYLRNNPLGGVDADGHCGAGPNDPPCSDLGANNPANQVQPRMKQEVHREATDSSKKAPGDPHGGNHEEAGEQHGNVVAPAVQGTAGKLTHSGANTPLESDPFNAKNPAQNLNANSDTSGGVVQSHAHPGGTDTVTVSPQNTSSALSTTFGGTVQTNTAFWAQTPSAVDIQNALPAPNLNIVVGAGMTGNPNNQPTVYFYTPAGTTCHVPLSQF